MKIYSLLFLALFFRLGALFVQRIVGMNWDFHVDANYYIESIYFINNSGVFDYAFGMGGENALYAIWGWVLWVSTLKLFEPHVGLIAGNILLSLITILLIAKIDGGGLRSKASPAAIFVALSPYLMHLSIHPLKDTIVLFQSMLLLLWLTKKRYFSSAIAATLLILTRFHLGIISVGLLVLWSYLKGNNTRRLGYNTIIFALMLVVYILAHDVLSERSVVEFEGRDFFLSGFALVPDNLIVRYFFGWFFNFFIPYPFFSLKISEFFYFTHIIFYYYLLIWSVIKLKKNLSDHAYGLIVISGLMFSFILTTTPGAGPLVRYRLFVELLLLIAINDGVVGVFRKTKKSAGRLKELI